MSAPSPGTRTEPTGEMLERGYRVVCIISGDEDINFFERSLKPPGWDWGERIDLTTQWNNRFKTFTNEALVDTTPMTFKACFDPDVLDALKAMAAQAPEDRHRTITIPLPNGGSWCFFGFVQKVDYDEMEPKNPPEATVTIVQTNRDPATKDEEGPVYTPPGT